MQNLQVLRGNRNGRFSRDSRLQKYAAKASLYAMTFAGQQRGAVVKIGYARVSTQDQNLDLQLKALKKAGCRKTFREKISGFNRQRPEFQRMLDQLRPSDTIVVWKLDRLARSTRDLLNIMETINEAGGKFQSLSEPWMNTTTHAGKMIMTVFRHCRVRARFDSRTYLSRSRSGETAWSSIWSTLQTESGSGTIGGPTSR